MSKSEYEAQRDAVGEHLKLGARVAALEAKVSSLRSEVRSLRSELKRKAEQPAAPKAEPSGDSKLTAVALGVRAAGRFF